MRESAVTKAFAAFTGVTGTLAMVFGAIFVWQGISEGWPHTVAFGIVGIGGLPIALGACPRIRFWRRKRPRNNLLTASWTLLWSN